MLILLIRILLWRRNDHCRMVGVVTLVLSILPCPGLPILRVLGIKRNHVAARRALAQGDFATGSGAISVSE